MSKAGGRSSAAWRTFSTTPTISIGLEPSLLSLIRSCCHSACGQESIGERRAHQRHPRRVRPVDLREQPSLQQRVPTVDG